jgi:hypothetical protein
MGSGSAMRIPKSLLSLFFVICFCQEVPAQSELPRFGIGMSASTLGLGIQAATAVTAHSNLRAGFNIFSYQDSFNKDGVITRVT